MVAKCIGVIRKQFNYCTHPFMQHHCCWNLVCWDRLLNLFMLFALEFWGVIFLFLEQYRCMSCCRWKSTLQRWKKYWSRKRMVWSICQSCMPYLRTRWVNLCTSCCCCCQVHLWAIRLQLFSGNVISPVQSLQPTLQLFLWAAFNNMWHRLTCATRALVSCCKAPLLLRGFTVALVVLEAMYVY